MQNNNPELVYQQLIAEITDEQEKKVFDVLLQAGDQYVTRAQLVLAVFGVTIPDDELANSVEDRKIREIIARLRERDYPIVSSSGTPGYTMQASEAAMDKYIIEQRSRIQKLQGNIDHAFRSKQRVKLVHDYRQATPNPVQLSIFDVKERQN